MENGDKLLIFNNITINSKKKEILKSYNKRRGTFSIPAILNKYNSNNKLCITVKKSFLDLLDKDNIYIINYDLVRIVNDEGFNYYLELEENVHF